MERVLKDPDLQAYYDELMVMFTTPGWKHLVEDAAGMAENYGLIDTITSMETLMYRRGQRDILNWLITRRSTVEIAFDQLVEEQEEVEL